jgi:hypothetical protein
LLQAYQFEKIHLCAQVHQQVQVTVLSLITAGTGSENGDHPRTEGSEDLAHKPLLFGAEHASKVKRWRGAATRHVHFHQELLEKECMKLKDDQVLDFAKRFWDPAVELGL